jgi:PUA domain protein
LDDLVPKKAKYCIMRLKDNNKADLIIKDNEIVCIKFKKSYLPTLRLLHKYPWIMPRMQVDKGGIKFVLNGANVMCPGLTSEGGAMDNLPVGAYAAIHAEGKEHAMGIGRLLMSTEEM